MEKKVGGLYLFVCKNYISLTCLNGFFAIFNFDDIYIKSNKHNILDLNSEPLASQEGILPLDHQS